MGKSRIAITKEELIEAAKAELSRGNASEGWYSYVRSIDVTKDLSFDALLKKKREIDEADDLLGIIQSIKWSIEGNNDLDIDKKAELLKKYIDLEAEYEKKLLMIEVSDGIYMGQDKIAPETSNEAAKDDKKSWSAPESHFNSTKTSDASWSEVDKTTLPHTAYAYVKEGVMKFPHHDKDGSININGLRAAKSAAKGARSGQNLVEKYPGALSHIDKHYAKLEKSNESLVASVSECMATEEFKKSELVIKTIDSDTLDFTSNHAFESAIRKRQEDAGVKKLTWEAIQDIPACMITAGMSLNGKFFYPAESIQKSETIEMFEGCKGYANHQPALEEGQARRIEDLVCRYYGVHATGEGKLLANKVSFSDNAKAVDIRKNLAWDSTSLDLSISASVECKLAVVEGREIFVVERFLGPFKPNCDIVSEGARGGNFTNINENLQASAKTVVSHNEGGNLMEFKDMPLAERIKIVTEDKDLFSAIVKEVPKDEESKKTIAELKESLDKASKDNETLQKHFLAMKRDAEITRLEKAVMEHIASKDFGEKGAAIIDKLKNRWQSRIDDLRKTDKPLFASSEAIVDLDEMADMVAPLIKTSTEANLSTTTTTIPSDQNKDQKKTEEQRKVSFDKLAEVFSVSDGSKGE